MVIGGLVLAAVLVALYLYKFRNDTFQSLTRSLRRSKKRRAKDNRVAPAMDVDEAPADPQRHSLKIKPHRMSSTIQMLQSNDEDLVLDTLGPRAEPTLVPDLQSDIQLDMLLAPRGSVRLPALKSPDGHAAPPGALPTPRPVDVPVKRKISLVGSRKVLPTDADPGIDPRAPIILTHAATPPAHQSRPVAPIAEEDREARVRESDTDQAPAPIVDDKRQTQFLDSRESPA